MAYKIRKYSTGIPATMQEVVDLQNQVFNLRPSGGEGIYTEVYDSLDALQKTLQTQEQAFYDKLGCRNFQGFQNRVQEVYNANPTLQDLRNKPDSEFQRLVDLIYGRD